MFRTLLINSTIVIGTVYCSTADGDGEKLNTILKSRYQLRIKKNPSNNDPISPMWGNLMMRVESAGAYGLTANLVRRGNEWSTEGSLILLNNPFRLTASSAPAVLSWRSTRRTYKWECAESELPIYEDKDPTQFSEIAREIATGSSLGQSISAIIAKSSSMCRKRVVTLKFNERTLFSLADDFNKYFVLSVDDISYRVHTKHNDSEISRRLNKELIQDDLVAPREYQKRWINQRAKQMWEIYGGVFNKKVYKFNESDSKSENGHDETTGLDEKASQ